MKDNWTKSYKFKTAWVQQFWCENKRWVRFSWEDGVEVVWSIDTGEGKIFY